MLADKIVKFAILLFFSFAAFRIFAQESEVQIDKKDDDVSESPESEKKELSLEEQIISIFNKIGEDESKILTGREESGLKDDAEIELTEAEIELLEQAVSEEEAVEKPPVVWKDIDILVPDNSRVKKARVQYLTNFSKKRFYQIIKNARPYQAFIRQKLREYDLPQALEYLPVIESGFVAKAVSKAGAGGMWQFMKNSIPSHIRVNEWLDERNDPWLMTDVALKKLRENYRTLGNWPLALAAYNAGLGGMRSRVKRYGTSDFWTLCDKGALKRETVDYVPRFLAVAEILTNADFYEIELPPEVEPPSFACVETKTSVDLAIFAEKLGIEKEQIFFLNPALKYTITPPGMRYSLRLPADKVAAAEELLRSSTDLIRYGVHKIRSGDTLSEIALHYGISVSMLQKANPKANPKALQLGQIILIPLLKNVAPMSAKKTNLNFLHVYTIKAGDTLWKLSRIYGVSVEDLAEANGISVNSALSIGKTLKVP